MKRVRSSPRALAWKDHLPLEYRYTHGVAGQRFFRSLKERGKLVGGRCSQCDTIYLPPRLYCTKCFVEINNWVELPPTGRLHSYTIVPEKGRKEVVGLIKFDGVVGGLVHKVRGLAQHTTRLDIPVRPVLRAEGHRTGSILDIRFFEPLTSEL